LDRWHDEGSRLDVLLQQLPIPPEKTYIVIINDEKVSREDYAEITIQSDDVIVLLPPIKGADRSRPVVVFIKIRGSYLVRYRNEPG